ncbi:MAG TPA: serine/threonine-protein kinase, partial [Archangium sp.]
MLCPRCKQVHPLGAACELVTGAIVGDYALVRELGRGAVGVVFLARHRTSGLEVALKLLHRHLAEEPVSVRRLTREARIAKELGPGRVVNVNEFHEQGPFGPWLVTEYLPGDSFLELARQRIAPDEALRVLALAAELLSQAHAQQVLHAALRPTNVFRLRAEGRPGGVLLLPFGVSLQPARSSEALEDREVDALGSAEFRPPEQTSGSPPDVRMDVYSLGAVAYLLATGRFPFTAPTPQALERAHVEVVPIAPHRINPRLSRGWSLTIMKALEKAPGARFQTMAEFAQALRESPAAPEPAGTTTAMFTRPAAVQKAPSAAKVGVVVLGGDDEPFPEPAPTPAGLGPITSGFARAALAPTPAPRPGALDGLFDDVPPPDAAP